ncbi:uncharacterized protein LOC121260300 [Juglans microcarpa x Juglans regia]|uniref:uncharacterized protein LOC121260300 n=1 Tax=Juglans microcarpa x Juglans regia TaxID=2249226 RepID=UPI001B7EA320|nr:uncharacterized protein LOC121260300 [Juglans microcarpa x Juglans regia]
MDGREQTKQLWIHEKLIRIDPIKKSLSYEVTENNVSIKTRTLMAILSTSVYPTSEESKQGCKIQWSLVANPIKGWRQDDSYLESSLQFMVKKIDDALQYISAT